MIVISQEPYNVSPCFRKNAEFILCFPSEGEMEVEWLKRSYQSLRLHRVQFESIILQAWRGGRDDDDEWGKHFLLIKAFAREPSQYFIDGIKRINFK